MNYAQNTAENRLSKIVSPYRQVEHDIIGTCIYFGSASFSKIFGILEKEHFDDSFCANLFEIMQGLYNDGYSWDIVIMHAEYMKRYKVSKHYEIAKMTMGIISDSLLMQKSVYLKEQYVDRLRATLSSDIMKGDNALVAFNDIQEKIQKALTINASDDWMDMSQVMISLMEHMDKVKNRDLLGIPTGLEAIDLCTAGFQKGQLITIAARPSVGKSAFIGGIAVHAAKQGFKVGIISLEMPEQQIGGRMLSIYSDVEFWRIYRNNFDSDYKEQQVVNSLNTISDLPIYLSTRTDVTASSIRAKAEKLMRRKGGLDLLIIDYLQLIEGDVRVGETREREISKLSRSLKKMAINLDIPVVTLAQLNRESERNKSDLPRMSQIRESGAIEQDSDVVMLLHRDWKNGKKEDENGNSTEFEADVIIEKCRNGETKSCKLSFDPEKMKFGNLISKPSYHPAPFDKPNSPALKAANNYDNDVPF